MSEQQNNFIYNESGTENANTEKTGTTEHVYEAGFNSGLPTGGGVLEASKENVLMGLVGALLGSLIGVICTVVIGQLGYVAAISGVVMGICAIKGYQILGHGFSGKAIVICVVVIIVMVYVSHWISVAFIVAEGYGIGFGEGFSLVHTLLNEGFLDGTTYWTQLAMLYVFTALGAVPTLRKSR